MEVLDKHMGQQIPEEYIVWKNIDNEDEWEEEPSEHERERNEITGVKNTITDDNSKVVQHGTEVRLKTHHIIIETW